MSQTLHEENANMNCHNDAAFKSCGNNQPPNHFHGLLQNFICTRKASFHKAHKLSHGTFLQNITTNQKIQQSLLPLY